MNVIDHEAECTLLTAQLRRGNWRHFLRTRGWGGGVEDCTEACVRVAYVDGDFTVLLSRDERHDVQVTTLAKRPLQAELELKRMLAMCRQLDPPLIPPPSRELVAASIQAVVAELREISRKRVLRNAAQSAGRLDAVDWQGQQIAQCEARIELHLGVLTPEALNNFLRGPASPSSTTTPEVPHGS